MKKPFFYAHRILVLFLLVAFTIPNSKNSFGRYKNDKYAADLDPAVYPLYTSNKEFKEMLNSLHKKFFTNRCRKLVFQYLYHKDNFTLGVYSGNKRQRDFHEQYILTPWTKCGKVEINNDFYLSDLEIDTQKIYLDTLRKLAADSDKNQYFVFMPSIDATTIPGKKVIQFKIRTVTKLEDICTSKWTSTTDAHTNPAPPRGGN